ncbi:MAG: hypothetical protein NTY74_07445 [Ignavibacteriae bacterium]|nr:hypothetical protein [Ignavibacteriota bacterium]
MIKTNHILRIGYFGSSNTSMSSLTDCTLGDTKDASHDFFTYIRSILSIDFYPNCIAGALKMHSECIGSAFTIHSKSFIYAFTKDSRCIKYKFCIFTGILNGLVHKFAIFLGRQPP